MQAGDEFSGCNDCRAVVIEYIDRSSVLVEFMDSRKHRAIFNPQSLRKGSFRNPFSPSVFSVGFPGVGKHSPTISGKSTPEYVRWKQMFVRCYDKKLHQRHPSYAGCTVHPDWHNFQNFADWFSLHPYRLDQYHLDKDILVRGNKIYSKDTCTLVPSEINNLTIGQSPAADGLPVGVVWNAKRGVYISSVRAEGRRVFLGHFATSLQAFLAYKQAKEKEVQRVAEKWKGKIEERAYDALMRWRVDP